MTFDEQLERAFGALTERLRDEVTRQVRLVGDEIAAAVPRAAPLRKGSTRLAWAFHDGGRARPHTRLQPVN